MSLRFRAWSAIEKKVYGELIIMLGNAMFYLLQREYDYVKGHIIQNSFSGIWPTLAKKCNSFASSFAKLSWSLFPHVGQLGISTLIPTFERPNCIFGPSCGCYPKLLHDRLTSSRKSQIPFAITIASFREKMFQALNSQQHKCRMPSTPKP